MRNGNPRQAFIAGYCSGQIDNNATPGELGSYLAGTTASHLHDERL